MRFCRAKLPLAAGIVLALACPAKGQLPIPQLRSVSPLGGQAGTEFELTISGEDLDGVRDLRFSHAGITAAPLVQEAGPFEDQPRQVPNRFVVKVAEDVPPGLYEVRAIGYFGVSNPRMLVIGVVSEATPSGEHVDVDHPADLEIGTAVSTAAVAQRVQYYRVQAPAGQKVLIECFAERLDSQMDATLVVYDQSGRELRRVRDTIGRDPVVVLHPSNARQFTVGVYDFTYGGGRDHFYRLAAHAGPKLLYAYPPVVTKAAGLQRISLFGWNLPGGAPVPPGLSLSDLSLEQVTVWKSFAGVADEAGERHGGERDDAAVVPAATKPHSAFSAGLPFCLEGRHGPTNPVFLQMTPHPVVLEQGENDTPERSQSLPVPCEFVGRLETAGDRDWVEFAGNAQDTLHLDVIADRIGAPTDIVITVYQVLPRADGTPQLQRITSVDDRAYGRRQTFDVSSTDPTVAIAVKKPALYRVEIRDRYGNPTGDPRLIYRLSVCREAPDFRLAAFVEPPRGADNQPLPIASLSLRRGGAMAVTVCAQRVGGFEGAIEVQATGLPAGTTCRPARIRPGESHTTLIISAAAAAPPSCRPIEIVGRAESPAGLLERTALGGTTTWPTPNPNVPPQCRLSHGVWLAVSEAPPVPVSLDLGQGPGAASTLRTAVGGKLRVPLHLRRRKGFEAEVNVAAVGLVEGLQFSGGTFRKDEAEKAMELFVAKGDFPPGPYDVHVRGRVRGKVPRNPAAIVRAERRKAHFEELFRSEADQAQQLAAALERARTEAETAGDHRDTCRKELATARQQAEEAVGEEDVKTQQLASARQQLMASPSNSESTATLQAAHRTLSAAIEAARVARTSLVQREADYAAAQAAADVAETRMQLIERKLQVVEQTKKQLEQLLEGAQGQLKEANKNHGPQDYEFEIISEPVRVLVEDAPIDLVLRDRLRRMCPDASVRIEVELRRKFGFEGEVEINLSTPEGLRLEASPVLVAADADSGTIEVHAGGDARLGHHSCHLEVTLTYNNVAVRKRVPLDLVITRSAAKPGH